MADVKGSAIALIAAASITATDRLIMIDDLSGTPTTYGVAYADVRSAVLAGSGAGWTATDYLGLGAGTIPSTGMLRVGQGAITTSAPLINATVTWNAGGVTFTHILVNVTDSASAAASLFADFQIAGVSKLAFKKDGSITASAGTAALQAISGTTLNLTGTLTGVAGTWSGLGTFNAGATVASGQTLTLTGATVAGTPTWSSSQAITLSTAAQPNITSVGTLTSLVLSGGISGVTTLAGTGAVSGFTTASFSGLFTSTIGNNSQWLAVQSATTGYIHGQIGNTGGLLTFGLENSTGGALMTGSGAYDTILTFGSGRGMSIGVTGAARAMRITAALTTIDSTTTGVQALTTAGTITIGGVDNNVTAGKWTVTRTTTQGSFNYDASNRFEITTGSTGIVAFNAVGAGASFTFGQGTTATTGTFSSHILGSGNVQAGASSVFYWFGRANLASPADGVITLYNSGLADFTRLQVGGTTASFPALARSGTQLVAVLADGSANAPFTCAALTATTVTGTGALSGFTTGVFSDNLGTATTKKIGLNAGLTTYISESSSGVIGVFGASTQIMNIQSNAFTITASSIGLLGAAYVTTTLNVGNMSMSGATTGTFGLKDASAPSTPSGGGYLYVLSGALKYIGSSGTVTNLGPA